MVTNNTSGKNSRTYMGVEAPTPPQFEAHKRAPTPNDYASYDVGTLWLNQAGLKMAPPVLPTAADLYMLVSKTNYVATWINFAGSAGPSLLSLTGNIGGAVFGDGAQNIDVLGDTNVGITVSGNPGLHQLTITTTSGNPFATSFPTDSGTAIPDNMGVLNIITDLVTNAAGSSFFFSGVGNTVLLNVTDLNDNTLVGKLAGNSTLSGTFNTGFGESVLHTLTTGTENNAFGFSSLNALTNGNNNVGFGTGTGQLITIGDQNTIIGSEAGSNLLTGSDNILIGYQAGNGYTNAETNNIIIGDVGTVGDTDTIRIGTLGSHTTNYQQGIAGVVVGNQLSVVIDSTTGQLGTNGVPSSVAGTEAFQAYLPTVRAAPLSNFINYPFGIADPSGGGSGLLIIVYDAGGNVFPGDNIAAPATFTAPFDGIYYFYYNVSVFAFGGGTLISSFIAWLQKNDGSIYYMGNLFSTTAAATSDQIEGSTQLQLVAGETVSWYMTAFAGPGGTTKVRNNSLTPPVNIQSQVGGYRIA